MIDLTSTGFCTRAEHCKLCRVTAARTRVWRLTLYSPRASPGAPGEAPKLVLGERGLPQDRGAPPAAAAGSESGHRARTASLQLSRVEAAVRLWGAPRARAGDRSTRRPLSRAGKGSGCAPAASWRPGRIARPLQRVDAGRVALARGGLRDRARSASERSRWTDAAEVAACVSTARRRGSSSPTRGDPPRRRRRRQPAPAGQARAERPEGLPASRVRVVQVLLGQPRVQAAQVVQPVQQVPARCSAELNGLSTSICAFNRRRRSRDRSIDPTAPLAAPFSSLFLSNVANAQDYISC